MYSHVAQAQHPPILPVLDPWPHSLTHEASPALLPTVKMLSSAPEAPFQSLRQPNTTGSDSEVGKSIPSPLLYLAWSLGPKAALLGPKKDQHFLWKSSVICDPHSSDHRSSSPNKGWGKGETLCCSHQLFCFSPSIQTLHWFTEGRTQLSLCCNVQIPRAGSSRDLFLAPVASCPQLSQSGMPQSEQQSRDAGAPGGVTNNSPSC